MTTFSRSGIRNFSVALPRAVAVSQFPAAPATSDIFSSASTAKVVSPELDSVDDELEEPVSSPQVDANQQRRKLVAPSSHESPSFMHDPIVM